MTKQKKILNRELSWLSFNERVLQEACDPEVPLIERVRFLGIFSNNLDEFFKVRVATIKRLIDLQNLSRDNLMAEKPKIILSKIQKKVIELQHKFEKAYQQIVKGLEKNDIFILNEKQIEHPEHRVFIKRYFEEEVFPALSPIMLNRISRFPYLIDRSIFFAIKLESNNPDILPGYALMEIPTYLLPRFIVLPNINNSRYIILLDDVIRYSLKDIFTIFPYNHFHAYTVKLTRDAELDIDNDVSKSYLEKIQKGVLSRRRGQPVRFTFDAEIPKDLLGIFKIRMGLDEDDNLIPGSRYHNFKDFMSFPNIGEESMLNPVLDPAPHKYFKYGVSQFDAISKRDILLHYPYQNFAHYINFLREAAIDPQVKEIFITIYRVSRLSKVVYALMNAARNGKQVTVNIELQARFDEKTNIYWSKKLEEVGAKVVFGITGLKVHAKLTLVKRMEDKKPVYYACVSTGNFHEGNARVYSDVTLFTKDRKITQDVRKVFELFESPYKTFNFQHLLVAPLYMRRRLYRLIDQEMKNAQEGKKAYIILKINNLVDDGMVKKLYEASNAGVKIKLIIRGICTLIPGVPGLSENIEAISIVDKYLEHTRVFVFCNNHDPKFYISSADWMTRNLDHRIETTCPIYDEEIKQELMDFLNIQFSDNVKSRILDHKQDNAYHKNTNEKKIRSQIELYNYYTAQGKPTVNQGK